ncbi:Uncharacterised protein [Mycobacteroides abscessus subsp. abscessus]|nr:Uncharacterised protein [Mycobacteroides abscessus subsp. abscessus]
MTFFSDFRHFFRRKSCIDQGRSTSSSCQFTAVAADAALRFINFIAFCFFINLRFSYDFTLLLCSFPVNRKQHETSCERALRWAPFRAAVDEWSKHQRSESQSGNDKRPDDVIWA